MSNKSLALRVARRFMAYQYKPKEKKRSKIERLGKLIRDKTGIGRGTAEDIADAIIRNRSIPQLSLQKDWPVEDGTIQGPKGSLTISAVREAL